MANRILGASGLRIEPADGHYVLVADGAGRHEAVADWGALGAAARRLTGRGLEPLAEALVMRLAES